MTRLSHSFSVEYAEKYGVECAILINHFQFWIEQNQAMGRNFHDGRTWMYQSHKEIASIYSYWNEDLVFRLIKKLVDADVLIKGNYNKTPFDKTMWYAFKNQEMFTKPQNCGIDAADLRNQKPQNCGIRNRKTAEPIPDTKTDTKKEQQQEAAASLENKEKQQPKKPSVYRCLDRLDIPLDQKEEVTRDYSEPDVEHGVNWVLHPGVKINKDLVSALKWACKVKPAMPVSKTELIEKNRQLALKYDDCASANAKFSALSKYVEILIGGTHGVYLNYDLLDFNEQLKSLLRKNGFTVLHE